MNTKQIYINMWARRTSPLVLPLDVLRSLATATTAVNYPTSGREWPRICPKTAGNTGAVPEPGDDGWSGLRAANPAPAQWNKHGLNGDAKRLWSARLRPRRKVTGRTVEAANGDPDLTQHVMSNTLCEYVCDDRGDEWFIRG